MPRTSNLEYWRAREETQRQKNITDEREIQRRIQEIYTEMLSNVEKEINGFYAKYARAEGITISEAKRRAEKADIEALGLKAKRYVKEKDFSKLANAEMRLYNMTMKANRLELLKADIGLEMVAGFNEVEKTVGNALTERVLGEFERQAGILGKSILNNAESAKTIVNASFNNAKFSDRIWMYQDMLKHELAQELQTGLIQGRNPRQLATHIRKRFGVSQSNAERLMVTEMARVQVAAQMESYKRNGFDHYMFIAEHDRRTCAVCGGLDGKNFLVSEEQPGLNAPPMHPNCRCSTAAWMDRAEVERELFGDKFEIDREGERDRRVRYGEEESFDRPKQNIQAKEVKTSGNRLYIDNEISLSRKQVREFDRVVSEAKRLLGITNTCDAPVVITNNRGRAASYNPRMNVLYIDAQAINEGFIERTQQKFAAPTNRYSTVVHELYHWIDAEEYRGSGKSIDSSDKESPYMKYLQAKAKKELERANIDLKNVAEVRRSISYYAVEKLLENDYDEVYTEYRTKQLLENTK